MSKITVLVVEPGKKPYVKEIANTLKSLQKEIGGYIQAVYPWNESVALICDEESKLKNKPFNRALRDEDGKVYDIVAGTFLIVGLSEENFCSLSKEQIERLSRLFQALETFILGDEGIIVLAEA